MYREILVVPFFQQLFPKWRVFSFPLRCTTQSFRREGLSVAPIPRGHMGPPTLPLRHPLCSAATISEGRQLPQWRHGSGRKTGEGQPYIHMSMEFETSTGGPHSQIRNRG